MFRLKQIQRPWGLTSFSDKTCSPKLLSTSFSNGKNLGSYNKTSFGGTCKQLEMLTDFHEKQHGVYHYWSVFKQQHVSLVKILGFFSKDPDNVLEYGNF